MRLRLNSNIIYAILLIACLVSNSAEDVEELQVVEELQEPKNVCSVTTTSRPKGGDSSDLPSFRKCFSTVAKHATKSCIYHKQERDSYLEVVCGDMRKGSIAMFWILIILAILVVVLIIAITLKCVL